MILPTHIYIYGFRFVYYFSHDMLHLYMFLGLYHYACHDMLHVFCQRLREKVTKEKRAHTCFV